MTHTIDITYQGALRTSAVHVRSKTDLVTDAPVDNNGRGESFSPTDLVATGLGTCMLTIMGIVADRHGWDLSEAHVEVTKVMAADPRRIARLEVTVRVPGDFDAQARQALERAALDCPVKKTLDGNVEMPCTFLWD